MKKVASLFLASLLGGALALGGYFYLVEVPLTIEPNQIEQAKFVKTNYIPVSNYEAEATDFTKAAEETVHAVVHVTNVSMSRSNPVLEFFYGEGAGGGGKAAIGTGSGVIISPDGYIITNNHVIKGAENIEITLNNKKSYKAKVIGAHASSDIALIKIEATDLPFVSFANSDHVKVGEWVLAVGNPFNLTSTVTAGIVSAKARNINISRGTRMIESFIQTDAAVNPGNSGGALVNVRGELVGINTAISSQTGSYVGYSFAVPSNIAKKVVEDLMEFGDVQTAYLGISYAELNNEVIKEFDLGITEGIFVTQLTDNGGAKLAGLQKHDVIINIDDVDINKFSDLQGYLSSKRPGDQVEVTVLRAGKSEQYKVRLKNQFGKEKIGKYDFSNLHLGTLSSVSKEKATKYKLNYGLEFLKVNSANLVGNKVKKGDIILKVNEDKIYSIEDIERLLRKNKGKMVVLQILNDKGYAEHFQLFVQN